MSSDNALGNIATVIPATLAARCADRLMEYKTPRAVCLDTSGRVWVERADRAPEADIVGVYSSAVGVMELTRLIRDDLQHEKEWRWKGGQPAKRPLVVSAMRQRGGA